MPYIRNNLEFITFTIIFILVNLGLCIGRIIEYWNFKNYDFTRNWWIIWARVAGQGLNFTSMFILVLMLRHCITKLRQRGLTAYLPLDRHIYFHKITGRLIVIYGLVHTGAHLGNLCKLPITVGKDAQKVQKKISTWAGGKDKNYPAHWRIFYPEGRSPEGFQG